MLAGDELRQIARLLRLAAVAHDLVDAEVRMRAVGEADRAGGARHFLHRHAMLEIAEAKPAVFLGRGDPVQAERPHLRPQVAGEQVVAVDRCGARGDLLVGELSRAVADHLGALAEVEVERSWGVGDHGPSGFVVVLPAGGHWRRTAGKSRFAYARRNRRSGICPRARPNGSTPACSRRRLGRRRRRNLRSPSVVSSSLFCLASTRVSMPYAIGASAEKSDRRLG